MDNNKLLAGYEEKIQNEIDKSGDQGNNIVTLLEPAKVSAKKLNGGWATIALIGDEQFTLQSCYVGKRKGLIFAMKPMSSALGPSRHDGFAYIEMSAQDAMDKMDGVKQLVALATGLDMEEVIIESNREDIEAQHKKQYESRKDEYGSEFGSW